MGAKEQAKDYLYRGIQNWSGIDKNKDDKLTKQEFLDNVGKKQPDVVYKKAEQAFANNDVLKKSEWQKANPEAAKNDHGVVANIAGQTLNEIKQVQIPNGVIEDVAKGLQTGARLVDQGAGKAAEGAREWGKNDGKSGLGLADFFHGIARMFEDDQPAQNPQNFPNKGNAKQK